MTFTRATYTYIPTKPRSVAQPSPSGGSKLTERVPTTIEWWKLASCRGDGNDYGNVWIYPSHHEESVVQAAVRLCGTCPVKAECVADAKQEAPIIGIRGGKVYKAADEKNERLLRVCVICGDEFIGYGPAKTCTTVCRVELRLRRDRTYTAKKRKVRSGRVQS